MPTIQQVILNLISGIDDPVIRVEVSKTLMFLYNVYASGKVSEGEVKKSVEEVVRKVLKAKHPELEPEQLKILVKQTTEEIMDAFSLQSIFRRTAVKAGF